MARKPKEQAQAENIVSPESDKPKAKRGAPSQYTVDMAKRICIRLSNGEALAQMIKDPDMPAQSTVYKWLLDYPEFTEMYTRAREEQADTNADEIIAIADEMPPEYTDKEGRTQLDSSYIAWQKNRIEARKWTAMKLKPRKYGDKMQVGGDPENPMAHKVSFSSFDTLIETLEARRQGKVHE